jgi:hypothetical protein
LAFSRFFPDVDGGWVQDSGTTPVATTQRSQRARQRAVFNGIAEHHPQNIPNNMEMCEKAIETTSGHASEHQETVQFNSSYSTLFPTATYSRQWRPMTRPARPPSR